VPSLSFEPWLARGLVSAAFAEHVDGALVATPSGVEIGALLGCRRSRRRACDEEPSAVGYRAFVFQSLANAVGTVLALAVVYLAGVIFGAVEFNAGGVILAAFYLILSALWILEGRSDRGGTNNDAR
jgi:hypothetical protein